MFFLNPNQYENHNQNAGNNDTNALHHDDTSIAGFKTNNTNNESKKTNCGVRT